MAQSHCSSCGWRARHDTDPKSFLGRLWRWHIGFCPGWKAYIKNLPEAEKAAITAKYNLKSGRS
jgi:hypothetical protein